jgi:hypothetical protein
MTQSETDSMYQSGRENESEAERIFSLLDYLKSPNGKQPIEYFINIESPWKVVFEGAPSLRHANRIAIFREFLSDVLAVDLSVAGGAPGSVAVVLAPKAGVSENYLLNSSELFTDKSYKMEWIVAEAKSLGISKIEFGGKTLFSAD